MSKIGKKPIIIPEGVELTISNNALELKKDNDALVVKKLPFIKIEREENVLTFSLENNSKQAHSNWGTIRALTNNAIIGLTEGYLKVLEIEGVGYRASVENGNLILNLGFSHPVQYVTPEGITITVEKNVIKVSGKSKELVGKVASEIRSLKKPEPYKGKGIRYQGEVIRRKAGKKAGSTK